MCVRKWPKEMKRQGWGRQGPGSEGSPESWSPHPYVGDAEWSQELMFFLWRKDKKHIRITFHICEQECLWGVPQVQLGHFELGRNLGRWW